MPSMAESNATSSHDRASRARRRAITFALTGISCLAIGAGVWLAADAAAALPGAPPQGEQTLYLPENPGLGARLFISKGCIACHAVRGEGGKIGPDLGRSTFGMNLTEIAAAMWNHAPAMARQIEMMGITSPTFARGEMNALIAFLYYLNFSESEPGDAERGRRLFDSKACSRCHSIGGRGGSIGPSIDRLEAFLSPVIVAQRLWNHGPEMLEAFNDLELQPPALTGAELADLITYLREATTVAPEAPRFRFPGNARNGESLFASQGCTYCHSGGGQGGGGAPDLSRVNLGVNVVELAARLWNHMPRMIGEMERRSIPMPLFTEDEMADLLSYLYSLHYTGNPGDPQRGQRLFAEMRCGQCHTVGGGARVGPDLIDSAAAQSVEEGVRLLWNHADEMVEQMAEDDVSWPRLSGDDISDILAYIRSSVGLDRKPDRVPGE